MRTKKEILERIEKFEASAKEEIKHYKYKEYTASKAIVLALRWVLKLPEE